MTVSLRWLRALHSRTTSRRRHMDIVVLAPCKTSLRLSPDSTGLPRMTEALREVDLVVRLGRVSEVVEI